MGWALGRETRPPPTDGKAASALRGPERYAFGRSMAAGMISLDRQPTSGNANATTIPVTATRRTGRNNNGRRDVDRRIRTAQTPDATDKLRPGTHRPAGKLATNAGPPNRNSDFLAGLLWRCCGYVT